MPDDPIIQVTYGEVRFVPATEPPNSPKRSFSLKRLSEAATSLWTLVFRTVLIGSVLAVLTITYNEVTQDTIFIEEIRLPEPLVEMGYSGTIATHRLWDSTQWIREHATASKERAALTTASRQLEITEPGTGLSLNGLVQIIRRLLGREQTSIMGEFVCRDANCTISEMELRLRAFHDFTLKVSGVGKLGSVDSETEIDAYFDRAALTLLKMIDPYVRANFFYAIEQGHLPEDSAKRAEILMSFLDRLPPDVTEPRSVVEAKTLIRRSHPQRAWAALLLSFHEQDAEKAMEWAKKSVTYVETDQIPPFPHAYISWGVSLTELGRHEEAIEKFAAAHEIDPGYSLALYNLGTSLGNLGRHEEAIEKFEAALKIDPGDTDALNNWGTSLGDLGRHEEAIEKYTAALDIDPEDADALNNLGNSLGDLGRHAEAIRKYDAALEIDPDYVGALYNLGVTQAQLRRHEKAFEKYIATLRLDPNHNDAFHNLMIVSDSVISNAGPERCVRFASLYPTIEKFADDPDRRESLTTRFSETLAACTPPNASELAKLQTLRLNPSTSMPAQRSISISPDAEWIKIVGDFPDDTEATIKLSSHDGNPFLQAFDPQHSMVAENDDDPDGLNELDSKISINLDQDYHLLRVRSLSDTETPATLSIELTEKLPATGD